MTRPVGGRQTGRTERMVQALLRAFAWLGIRINPFLVVREAEALMPLAGEFGELSFAVAGPADIDEMLRLQRGHTPTSLGQWLDEGKLCFIARNGGRLVALMWCDLAAFNYPPNFRELAAGEAYLFAAIADPEYRGRSVAPALRLFCYEELRKRGVTKFYSYTDYFNSAARRFKAKLGAREESLRIAVDAWGMWSGAFTLKRYR